MLGESGAGKSTTLLQFGIQTARDCLAKLSSDNDFLPVPIFCNISRWDRKTPICGWALQEVVAEFGNVALASWPFLYLFDGLEELGGERPVDPNKTDDETFDPRLDFLNAVANEIPLAPVVIACRSVDYEQIGERAAIQGTVTLLPLDSDQIKAFLEKRQQSPLWKAIDATPSLLELARSPLLLNLLSVAGGTDTDSLRWNTETLTASSLFHLYIEKRIERERARSSHELPFNEAETRLRLSLLAADMWSNPTEPATTIPMDFAESLLGEKYLEFIAFARAMQFLRESKSGRLRFLHLAFRDYCAVPALLEAFHAQYRDVRERAADALGNIGDLRAMPVFLEALTRDEVRDCAIHALAKMGSAVVPDLVANLSNPNIYVRHSAMAALGEIGNPEAVMPLLEIVRDQDHETRLKAISALGKIRDPRAVPTLFAALDDEDRHMRWYAASALGNIGDPRIIPMFLTTVRDSDLQATFLSQMDAEAVPALVDALTDKDPSIRASVAYALDKIGDPRAVPALIEMISDRDDLARFSAIQALSIIADARAVPALLAELQSNRRKHQSEILHTLGNIRDTRAVPALIDALRDMDSSIQGGATYALVRIGEPAVSALLQAVTERAVRERAIEILGEIGDARAVPLLRAALNDPDDRDNRDQVIAALVKIGKEAVPTFLDALADSDWKLSATTALGQIGDSSAVPALRKALEDNDKEIRWSALIALSEIADPLTTPLFIDALEDADSDIHWCAVVALRKIGDPRSIPALLEALNDRDLQGRAIQALGEIGGNHLVPMLVDALEDGDSYVRWSATDALCKIGDGRAIPALAEALGDENVYVRESATEALRKLADPRTVPLPLGALADPDKGIQKCAKNFIRNLGRAAATSLREVLLNRKSDESVPPFVIERLSELQDAASIPLLRDLLQSTDESVRETTIMALVRIGRLAIPALQEALQSTDAVVQTKATEALEKFARWDQEVEPSPPPR